MRGPKTLPIRDFSAGLVQTEGGIDLPLGAAQAMQNMLPIGRRGLKSRAGAGLSTMAEDVVSTFYSAALGGAVALGATDAHRVSNASDMGAHGFTTPRLAGFADGAVSGGQGPLYMQQSGVAKYVTAAWALGTWTAGTGTLPLSANGAIAYHGNRMWVGGVSATPSRLFFSEIQDPRVWSGGTAGYVDIDVGVGGITALCPCGPYLLVFKADRCYAVYDLNTGANRPLSTKLGVAGQTNVVPGEYGAAFFASTGRSNLTSDTVVYETDGNTIKAISPLINPGSDLAFGGGVLAVCDNTTSQLLAYITEYGSWWRMDIAPARDGGWVPGNVFGRHTFYVPGSSGKLFTLDIDYYNEAAGAGADVNAGDIAAYWWGGDMDLDAPELRKRLRSVDVEGSGTIALGMTINCATSAPNTSALTFLPASSTVGSARLNSLGVARYWAPYLSSTSAFTVRALTLNYGVRGN